MANVLDTNLNLLVALDALLLERSVTRAATRMGITQSSMSGALARLREIYGDPLLVRIGRRMEATPLALRIAPDIRRGIEAFNAALAGPPHFDAATSRERFVLAMSDFSEFVLLPRLLQRLSKEAPGINVQVLPWGRHEPPVQLATGEFDLMTGFYDSASLSPGYREELLFETWFTSIVRRDHSRVADELTLDLFCDLHHVVVTESPDGSGVLDNALAKLGRHRHVAARVPHFMVVPTLVAQTELIATVEGSIARHYQMMSEIRALEPPLPLPRGKVGMVWHRRTTSDPARRWLRQMLKDIARDIESSRSQVL